MTGCGGAENVNVEFPIPKFSKYVSYETDNQDVTITEENGIIRASKPTLEKEEKIRYFDKSITSKC